MSAIAALGRTSTGDMAADHVGKIRACQEMNKVRPSPLAPHPFLTPSPITPHPLPPSHPLHPLRLAASPPGPAGQWLVRSLPSLSGDCPRLMGAGVS